MGDIGELFGLVIGFCLVVGIPAIAIMTAHQRKMAELFHKNQNPAQQDEVVARLAAMQQQLNDMQDRQNELILQRYEQSPSPKVEDRIQD